MSHLTEVTIFVQIYTEVLFFFWKQARVRYLVPCGIRRCVLMQVLVRCATAVKKLGPARAIPLPFQYPQCLQCFDARPFAKGQQR